MQNKADFSLHGLYEALDAQRQARGLTWAEATRQIYGLPGRPAGHRLSVSTVRATRIRRNSEGDGILSMLRWLNRSPESFVAGYQPSDDAHTRLPDVPSGKIMRFDTKKIYAALDTLRAKRGLNWSEVGREVGTSPSILAHLANGGRTGFPGVMRILRWLNQSCASFVRFADL